MKKLFLSMMVASVLFASCSSDDNGSNPGPDPGPDPEENVISGDITENTTLTAENVYTLRGAVYVKDGVTLTIEPGTRIEAEVCEDCDVAFLALERGAMINAQGTAEAPIIFTSGADTPEAGQWGGIVICGNAITNTGTPTQAEVTGLEYGGDNPEENSGTLSHIIIEYSGNLINEESEFNALTFYAVGSGTTVNNIFINQVSDDGIEFFGGSVNVDHVTVIGSQDDSFDWTDGWNGHAQFIYADQSAATAFSSDSRGIEADNREGAAATQPVSSPTIEHLTLIGRNSASVTSEAGIKLRRGTFGDISDVYLKDFVAGAGIDVEGPESIAHFKANPIVDVHFENVPNKGTDATTFTENAEATGAGNGAELPDWASWASSHIE